VSITKKAMIAAALAATGVATLGMRPTSAATEACGSRCISLFSAELGTTAQPNVVETVLDGVARVGQPVILEQASSSNSAQDIIVNRAGTVAQFYSAGLVSADVNYHYSTLNAAMIEYAPLGRPTGLCVGLEVAAFQGEALSLQPCTVGARTVWIIDPDASTTPGYFAVLSGSTTDFSHPFAMHFPRDEYATQVRTQEIEVRHLQFLSYERVVPDRQLWGIHPGVV
jgi:hypothetical protein